MLGHYEIACGGGDTISNMLKVDGEYLEGIELVYALIRRAALQMDVIYEGLMISSDVNRCVALAEQHQLLVIGLTTPLEECIRSVEQRRDERAERRGKEAAPLKLNRQGLPKTIVAKHKALITQREHFRAKPHVDFRALDREHALKACLVHLGLDALS